MYKSPILSFNLSSSSSTPTTPNAPSIIPVIRPTVPIIPLPIVRLARYSANLLEGIWSPLRLAVSILSMVFSSLANCIMPRAKPIGV